MFFINLMQETQETIELLYAEYKSMMLNLAYSILGDYQYAEDAVQEALIVLSKNINKMDSIYSDRSRNYIYTVTKNEALTLNKKNENFMQCGNEAEVDNVKGDVDIKAFCNKYGFSDNALEIISSLDEVDKDILLYKYGKGYSVKEIARLINRNQEYIYKRLQRVTKKLTETQN